MSALCGPGCGWCSRCSAVWERDGEEVEEFVEPDLPELFRENDALLEAMRQQQEDEP